VEYRLSPEAKAPSQVEDSYAGLNYIAEHATELGINTEKIVVHGASAGGGLGKSYSHRNFCPGWYPKICSP
jgi:acetyl esterase/lipase